MIAGAAAKQKRTLFSRRKSGVIDHGGASGPARLALSVIVCTRNRADSLHHTLSSLEAAHRAASVDWELIVVDNASRDHTEAVVGSWAGRVPFSVRRVVEPRPGLAIARNAGMVSARGEIFAFTDDDCRVDEHWLGRVTELLAAPGGPDLIGGKVTLFNGNDAPVAIRTHDDRADIRDVDEMMLRLIGCNFAMRRAVVERVGRFDERLGAGTRAGSAEDSDFFYRALRAGFAIVYEPTLKVSHAHGRRQSLGVAALHRGYVVGRAAFGTKHILRGDREIAKRLYWEIRKVLGVRRRDGGVGPLSRVEHLGALGRGILLRLCGL